MLRGIAVFSMQGRWQAAIAVALLSLGALMLPPLSYLVSGVISLSTLRMGPKEGAKIVVASTVVFTLLAGLLLGQFYISGLFLLSSWLPILGISLVLGYTRSLALSLLAAGGLGIVLVLVTYLVLPDPALWWQEIIEPFMATFVEQPSWQLDESETQLLLSNLSGMMTGLIAAGFSLNLMLGLLIGRAWQAKLYNPGGFASEFTELKLGKPAAIVTTILMVAAISPLGESLAILQDCLPVILTVFALQGLSVVHAIVRQKQKHTFWLVAIYVLLIVILPQMMVLLAMIGVLEQWFNFRRHSSE
ncbi:MAG: DUF2232 domain-containing protein [Gammaproteobacteria bacterium]|nr:DUF2232 domain-containing protein [Gammaproteobacteria bacterium]